MEFTTFGMSLIDLYDYVIDFLSGQGTIIVHLFSLLMSMLMLMLMLAWIKYMFSYRLLITTLHTLIYEILSPEIYVER